MWVGENQAATSRAKLISMFLPTPRELTGARWLERGSNPALSGLKAGLFPDGCVTLQLHDLSDLLSTRVYSGHFPNTWVLSVA